MVQGKDLGGEIIPMDTRVVYAADTSDPNLWALYDVDSAAFWVNTESVWNSYLN